MVHFVGAGSGAPDLITLRGARLLEEADVILYAGSLVNPALLDRAKPTCSCHNTAAMTLEEVLAVIRAAEAQGKQTVRLHTGDPSLYGAVREQFDALNQLGIPYDVCPGVSAFCGAVCAACGSGAGITYLHGGDYDAISRTITNTLANASGIVCDGAKGSCAAKIATSVDAAILAHEMSLDGNTFGAGEGLVKENVEKTIASIGRMAADGMRETDSEILRIMIDQGSGC